MLQDTSKITGAVFDPSAVVSDDEEGDEEAAVKEMSWEEQLQRPCLGDDGFIAPELLELWARTLTTGTGVGYRLKRSVRRQIALARVEEEEEEQRLREERELEKADDVEEPRFEGAGMDGDNFYGDDDGFGAGDDDFAMGGVDDSFGSFKDATVGKQSMGGAEFGAAVQEDLGDEIRAKAHDNTIKVLNMLKTNMDDIERGPKVLSFDGLSEGCSRRVASGVFYELLTLMTKDFVGLEQVEAYGDIKITPGVKFREEIEA